MKPVGVDLILARARAAERELAQIARRRRPSRAELARAHDAYAAAAQALKRGKLPSSGGSVPTIKRGRWPSSAAVPRLPSNATSASVPRKRASRRRKTVAAGARR
jgi:hypothetical protein